MPRCHRLAALFALAAIVAAMAAPAQQRRPGEHAKPLVSLSSHKTLSFEVLVTEKQQPKVHPPQSPRRIRVVAAPPARVRLSTDAPRRIQPSDGGSFVRDFDLANLLVSDGVVQLRLYDVMRRYRSDRAAAKIARISDPLAWLAGVDVLFDTDLSAFGDGKRIRHEKVAALEFTYEVATPDPARLVLRVDAVTRLPLRLAEWARMGTAWHEVTRRDYSRWRVDRKLPADVFVTKPPPGYTRTAAESGP